MATEIARLARSAFVEAQRDLSIQSREDADAIRVEALSEICKELEAEQDEIRSANRRDVEEASALAEQGQLSKQLVSRLDLFSKKGKWETMLQGVTDVARLPSPLDVCTWSNRLAGAHGDSGAMDLYRVTCPIGVLLCIFEARPEVIVNIASLAIKSGNAAILKGGKESKHTAAVLARCIARALAKSQLPKTLVQTVETREEIQTLLHEEKYIDLVIPRGSNALVKSIQREARMPVMGHADGLCAMYIHEDAVESMVIDTVLDSKLDYPSACNALETLLIHRKHLSSGLWTSLAEALLKANVRLHCDAVSLEALSCFRHNPSWSKLLVEAKPEDYDTEYLDLDLAVRVVDSVTEAVDHINAHGSGHTDVILTAPQTEKRLESTKHSAADIFTRSLSSSSVFVNASSRFADGFRYGFGTEVGISTGRTHARGPVGLDGLVIYKYILRAAGKGAQTASAFATGDEPRAWLHEPIADEN
ncbi:glutamate-5-semialdehyde dehydrogenase [Malassezia psittaci]|uniref:glutamate-5-semialdehyde dehydrogenase n=1 Tax=Malassezia psittaci TaxID=1821823 RepID=A0AAF0F306_9BASI|nr:glutamate-5-semialdehyde dehydrogenase [Malassezia psittaci]